MDIRPVTLSHRHARLEPLTLAHADDLARFLDDADTWRYLYSGPLDTPEKLRAWIEPLTAEAGPRTGVAFAIVDAASGTAVGSTSLFDYSANNRGVEIGRTWIGKPFQRTALNTECKYLLLRHAFETLGCLRVQLKTDARNLRSQAAIERIGAVREGVLRAHMVLPDGHVRDTAMFSVIAPEWPDVKARLETMMARYEGR